MAIADFFKVNSTTTPTTSDEIMLGFRTQRPERRTYDRAFGELLPVERDLVEIV